MSLNMKKEIRQEIGILKRAIKKIIDDKQRAYTDRLSLDRAALKEFKKKRAMIVRESVRVAKRCERQISKAAKRILILEGRLS